jgi:hypothetical protein
MVAFCLIRSRCCARLAGVRQGRGAGPPRRGDPKVRPALKRNGFKLNRHFALARCSSMIFSENLPAFRDHALIGREIVDAYRCP